MKHPLLLYNYSFMLMIEFQTIFINVMALEHIDHANTNTCTQLTYFLSFSTGSVFPLHFGMSRIFYFVQGPKRQGSVSNFRVTLV